MEVLTGLFDRVGLQTNIEKMVVRMCQPCYIVGGHSEASYMCKMTDVVPSFR